MLRRLQRPIVVAASLLSVYHRWLAQRYATRATVIYESVMRLAVGIPAGLHPLGLARHLRSADHLSVVLTSAKTSQIVTLCDLLSGEFSPRTKGANPCSHLLVPRCQPLGSTTAAIAGAAGVAGGASSAAAPLSMSGCTALKPGTCRRWCARSRDERHNLCSAGQSGRS